jgi:hypothetical protein
MRLYLTLKGTDVENCGNDHEDADSEEYMSLAMEALNPDRHCANMAQEDTPTEDALDDTLEHHITAIIDHIEDIQDLTEGTDGNEYIAPSSTPMDNLDSKTLHTANVSLQNNDWTATGTVTDIEQERHARQVLRNKIKKLKSGIRMNTSVYIQDTPPLPSPPLPRGHTE